MADSSSTTAAMNASHGVSPVRPGGASTRPAESSAGAEPSASLKSITARQGAVLGQLGRPTFACGPAEAITDTVGRGNSAAGLERLESQRHHMPHCLGQPVEKRE